MKVKSILICLLMLFMLGAAACGQETEETSEEKTRDEGTDTSCDVSYVSYEGEHAEMFLKDGDKVAVISPSALPTREQADAVIKGLKDWGYVPVEGKYVCTKDRTLKNCLEDLVWALEDPEIKAVYCVRGGCASSEVMDIMPEGLIASANKLIIGFSDISVYHSAWTSAGLPSIHSCMSGTFMDLLPECAEAEEHIIKGEIPSYTCKSSFKGQDGEAEGLLIGGNLATFISVLGTDYNSSLTDEPYILFLEDVEEDLANIQRYLTVLKHFGVLEKAQGVIFGEWTEIPTDLEDYKGDSRGGEFTSVADMISRQFPELNGKPVAYGFPAGHADVNYPLLMGETVHLSVSGDTYSISW